jgi:hypothetical protein
MVDISSIASALGSIKTAADLAKGFLDLKEAAALQSRVIDLQKTILAAQSSVLDAQSEQLSLLEDIRSLKEKIVQLETWEAEKKRYELKNLGYSAFAYVLKPNERGNAPAHWVCTNCFENRHIAVIQYVMKKNEGQVWLCPSCKNTIEPGTGTIKWPD